MKENTLASKAGCLLGFVNVQNHFQWEYSFEFACWESKREQATIKNTLCLKENVCEETTSIMCEME